MWSCRALAGACAVAAALAVAGCAAKAPPPTVLPPVPPAPGPAWSDATPRPAGAVLQTALGLVGTPYREGGSDARGFDCSGFVQFVFARHGLRLPRTVASQFREGTPILTGAIRAGDLLFFTTTGPGPTHVALALANRRFVHAPSGRGAVRVDDFAGRYWPARFLGARRVIVEGPGAR
jgi:cell wall-associated NlpC family hydrolase